MCIDTVNHGLVAKNVGLAREGTVLGCKLLLAIVAQGAVEFSSTKGHLGIRMKASFSPPDAQLLVNLLFFFSYI